MPDKHFRKTLIFLFRYNLRYFLHNVIENDLDGNAFFVLIWFHFESNSLENKRANSYFTSECSTLKREEYNRKWKL